MSAPKLSVRRIAALRSALALFCVLGAATAACAAAGAPARAASDGSPTERRTIVVGINTDYPPFEYR